MVIVPPFNSICSNLKGNWKCIMHDTCRPWNKDNGVEGKTELLKIQLAWCVGHITFLVCIISPQIWCISLIPCCFIYCSLTFNKEMVFWKCITCLINIHQCMSAQWETVSQQSDYCDMDLDYFPNNVHYFPLYESQWRSCELLFFHS